MSDEKVTKEDFRTYKADPEIKAAELVGMGLLSIAQSIGKMAESLDRLADLLEKDNQ